MASKVPYTSRMAPKGPHTFRSLYSFICLKWWFHTTVLNTIALIMLGIKSLCPESCMDRYVNTFSLKKFQSIQPIITGGISFRLSAWYRFWQYSMPPKKAVRKKAPMKIIIRLWKGGCQLCYYHSLVCLCPCWSPDQQGFTLCVVC